MWLAIKLHMHSVYPNPIQCSHLFQPLSQSRHTSTYAEGKNRYIRRGEDTMGREEATSGNNLSCLWQGAKTKEIGGLVAGQW